MLVLAFMLAVSAAGASAEMPTPQMSAFERDATNWLLEGRDLPPDYRLRLLEMGPSERLQILVFLRRSGLLTGDSWSLDDILRPGPKDNEVTE
ncbi:hypothetical protein PAF17_14725 [Paracoccus sp. Z330]|uniref:Helix-hairpin-helix domain-containing protein n=1 Tax=Paracoccus onchidii TaxID=3017813 RepID=A0ABT4ZHB3_9RHOB|nr:hypothetical protein [Paracoccus onchidii]MDB6178749.1 hypothetical protein [Paracoccus onchidii]